MRIVESTSGRKSATQGCHNVRSLILAKKVEVGTALRPGLFQRFGSGVLLSMEDGIWCQTRRKIGLCISSSSEKRALMRLSNPLKMEVGKSLSVSLICWSRRREGKTKKQARLLIEKYADFIEEQMESERRCARYD